jgi:hypothetical protein
MDGQRNVSGLEISTSGSARDQGFVTGLRFTLRYTALANPRFFNTTETWTFPNSAGSTA